MFILLTDFVLLVPITYTIGVRYHITNAALVGACILPLGIGNIIGAPLAGRMSDRMVVQWREKRGGIWHPEDRLRATLFGAAVLVPFSVLASGLVTQFIEGKIGLVLNLVCLFINGLGVDLVLSPSAAYIVDVMHARSAESTAANSACRSMFMALLVAGIFPCINLFGVAITNAIAASLALVGAGLLWCLIRYGAQMRAWVDVGYATAEDN